MGARYYKPEVGRWITRDDYLGEQEEPQTKNRYVYCENNPVNLVDSSGNRSWWRSTWSGIKRWHRRNDYYSFHAFGMSITRSRYGRWYAGSGAGIMLEGGLTYGRTRYWRGARGTRKHSQYLHSILSGHGHTAASLLRRRVGSYRKIGRRAREADEHGIYVGIGYQSYTTVECTTARGVQVAMATVVAIATVTTDAAGTVAADIGANAVSR